MNRVGQFLFALITLWVVACSEGARTNKTADLHTPTLEIRTPSLQPTPTRTRSPYILDVFTPQAQQVEGLQVELLPNEDYTDAILHITRNGIEEHELSMFGIIGDFSSIGNVRLLSIQDLDLDGEVEIVLDTFLHGAYCCTVIAVVYFYKSVQKYISSKLKYRKWGL
jgi:hypothetical protein